MKRFLIIGVMALGAVAVMTTDAVAQDTVRRAGMLARTPSYSSLLSAIAATAASTQKVTSRSVVPADIRVVEAITVIGSDNEEPVRAALERHRDLITRLRAAIATNMAYTAALASHREKPSPNDVIAVDILDAGDVLVYFRKTP